jgi:hypothetical protein
MVKQMLRESLEATLVGKIGLCNLEIRVRRLQEARGLFRIRRRASAGRARRMHHLPRTVECQRHEERHPCGQGFFRGQRNHHRIDFGFGTRGHLHPLRVPDDPDHGLLLLNRTTRRFRTGAGTFCLGIIVLFTGLGSVSRRSLGPSGVVQLGSSPWVNGFIASDLFRLRPQPAGRLRNHHSIERTHADERASNAGGYIRLAADGPYLRADLIRLRRAVHGNAAGGFGHRRQAAAGNRHGDIFKRPRAALLSCWRYFPSWLAKMPRSGEWLIARQSRDGILRARPMLKYL